MSAQFPIVDAHQHFWDPRANYHPWLCDQPPIPFRYGDYSALRRPYLPSDYFADAGAHEVVKTVYVETEWDPRDRGAFALPHAGAPGSRRTGQRRDSQGLRSHGLHGYRLITAAQQQGIEASRTYPADTVPVTTPAQGTACRGRI